MKRVLIFLVLLWCLPVRAVEVIPPAPEHYFNDYAHVTSEATASRLSHELADFERQTSSQIWVVVYPKMQSDSSIEDYTLRVARAWKVGQKEKNNGAILFVFIQDHKMFIQVGYGLEGAMPDAICKDIIADRITPYFKRGDFNGGLSAGVAAMMAAAKGEYKGTGRTVAERNNIGQGANSVIPALVGVIFFVVIFFIIIKSISGGGRGGRGGGGGWGNFATGWMIGSAMSNWNSGGGGGGGGWSGGGWSGGGGGGGGDSAAGGGGSFGGGGAGGSW